MQSRDSLKQVFIRPGPELRLHRDQIRVINVLRGQSKCESIESEPALRERTKHADAILEYMANRAPLIIHISDINIGRLSADTYYRSAFEIHDKGACYLNARIKWESDCFHQLYDDVTAFERPKYGALNYLNAPAGVPCARTYGEWFLELMPAVRQRVTLATGDTAVSRTLGVLDFCAHVLTSLSDKHLELLGQVAIGAIDHADYPYEIYKEIQIHGEIKLDCDIAGLHVPKKEINNPRAVQFSKLFGVPIVEF